MKSSREWLRYYQNNLDALRPIPWERGPELTTGESQAVARSVQEFQVGESSEGRHLLRNAQAYAERTGDFDYAKTMRLFIAEEQRHARDLGRFLRMNGIALVKSTFSDKVFRTLRNLFPGLELSIAVLVTAEIIAKVYYAALRAATQSVVLRALCDQILSDELQHVDFQSEQLAKLRRGRGAIGYFATMALQRFLFLGATLVVWSSHRRVMQRAQTSFGGWWDACWREFNGAFDARPARDVMPSAAALPEAVGS